MVIEAGSGWWVALLGWPAVASAVMAFAVAVARKSRGAAIAGCLLAAPFFFYITLAPRFHWVGPLSFASLCILAWRIRQSSLLVTCILALPATSLLTWLAYLVLSE
jgi:hypothetical protein